MKIGQAAETERNDLLRLVADAGRALGPELAGQFLDIVATDFDWTELPILGTRAVQLPRHLAAEVAQDKNSQRGVRTGRELSGFGPDAEMDFSKILLQSHDRYLSANRRVEKRDDEGGP